MPNGLVCKASHSEIVYPHLACRTNCMRDKSATVHDRGSVDELDDHAPAEDDAEGRRVSGDTAIGNADVKPLLQM